MADGAVDPYPRVRIRIGGHVRIYIYTHLYVSTNVRSMKSAPYELSIQAEASYLK